MTLTQQDIEAIVDSMISEDMFYDVQLNKFHNKHTETSFKNFVEKVIAKYNSDKYRDRWYNKGIEPPESLLWFLLDYARTYGRECNESEWIKYSNIFTTELYHIHNYYFMRVDGQGSLIKVFSDF